MARWTIEEQIEKIDAKIKELQARKKELTARQAKRQKTKESGELKALHAALKAKGIEPEQYGDVIKKM